MEKNKHTKKFVMGLDVSTKVIGIALFEDLGDRGALKLLHHVTPVIKPQPVNKMQELFEKVKIFEDEFLKMYKDIGITKVIIEEPLLRSNNVNTVATLLRFNGMISRAVYDILGVIPEYISSYDSRAYAFPELMQVRALNKKGEQYSQKELSKAKPVLFGAYDFDVDKKMVVWEKVSELEPQIVWLVDKKQKLKKENFDMADSYTCCLAYMNKVGLWSPK
jgi:Holliday junction resolvasome RuvABC endonuclease subunit